VTETGSARHPIRLGFRGRLVLAFVSLLLATVFVTLFIVRSSAERNARTQVQSQLQVSERVWERLTTSSATRLLESVNLLAKDFGFRKAVATRDEKTIQSALMNHGLRIKADVGHVLDVRGDLHVAMNGPSGDPIVELAPLFAAARDKGEASDVVSLDGLPSLVAVVPVMAPRRIGWVAMGIHYGDVFAREIRDLVGLDVIVSDQNGRILASTLPMPDTAVSRLTAPEARTTPVLVGDRRWMATHFDAAHASDDTVRVILMADWDEAMAGHRRLTQVIFWLTAVATGVAIGIAVMIAGGISRPVLHLAEAVRRITAGNYAETLPVHGDDELAALAGNFNTMQHAIAEREARIRYQASHDTLTGLPNRASALAALERMLDTTTPGEQSCAALMIDLDRFKEVNDTLGHAFGDEVLRVVARRLQAQIRGNDHIARLGGDEFLVLLANTGERAAIERAQALRSALDAPLALERAQLSLDASIGIAMYPQQAQDAAMLLRRADIAMYEAKSQHMRVALYTSGRDEHHLRQVALMGDLKFALDRHQMSVVYQPKVDVATGAVIQVESLLRWFHPTLGRIPPDEFIPLAERSGLIGTLTRFVIEHSLGQCAPWIRSGLIRGVAVNLSPVDLLDDTLPAFVHECLGVIGLDGEHLMLEITESTAMHDVAASMRTMFSLRQIGAHLSIDDFGTGHSSLAKLRSLPVNEIKIDRSFISTLGADGDDGVIVRSAIEIGHNMGLKVIAEGVEDERALNVLRHFNCDMVQGFLFSAPLAADAFEAWCRDYRSKESSR